MRGGSRITGFLFITQLDDATVRHGSVVLRRPSSSIDRDFVTHNVHSTPPLIFAARCYASAACAVMRCPSVRQVRELCQNE